MRERLARGEATPPRPHVNMLARLGERSAGVGALLVGHLGFLGATLAALGAAVLDPKRLRLRELTVQLEQTGLNAIPVVALVTAFTTYFCKI